MGHSQSSRRQANGGQPNSSAGTGASRASGFVASLQFSRRVGSPSKAKDVSEDDSSVFAAPPLPVNSPTVKAPSQFRPLPDMSSKDREKRRVLCQAVLAGDVQTINKQLKEGVIADGPFNEENNQTLMHYAAIIGSRALIDVLLTVGGLDPEVVDIYGWTPMRYAYFYGKSGMVEGLQAAGVELSETLMADTWTPLMQATAAGVHQQMANLIQLGHSVDETDISGQTALHRACVRGDCQAALLLLRNGASPNPRDIYGWTPLMCAARCRHAGLLEVLLKAGGEPRYVDIEGFSILHTAAQLGDLNILTTILDWRSDLIDMGDHRNRTALMLASQYKHADVVDWLLSEGAAVDTCSQRDETVLGMAVGTGPAAYHICERLLRSGADPNKPVFVDDKQTALMVAAHRNAHDLVGLLLRFGASLEQEDKDGTTALSYAADGNSEETVWLLLEAGANPDASRGLPLQVASRHGLAKVVYALLCHNASPHRRQTALLGTCMSPLHFAANFGHTQAATYLLQAGASRTDKDQYGFVAGERAEQQGYHETAELIRTYKPTLQEMCAAIIWKTARACTEDHTACREVISKLPLGHIIKSSLKFPFNTDNMFSSNMEPRPVEE